MLVHAPAPLRPPALVCVPVSASGLAPEPPSARPWGRPYSWRSADAWPCTATSAPGVPAAHPPDGQVPARGRCPKAGSPRARARAAARTGRGAGQAPAPAPPRGPATGAGPRRAEPPAWAALRAAPRPERGVTLVTAGARMDRRTRVNRNRFRPTAPPRPALHLRVRPRPARPRAARRPARDRHPPRRRSHRHPRRTARAPPASGTGRLLRPRRPSFAPSPAGCVFL
jgi:hypothetical protein